MGAGFASASRSVTPDASSHDLNDFRRIARPRTAYIVTAVLGLTPILTVIALRLPLINQLNYADPWFYSAFAWVPKHQFAVFGWNYFSVRFPAILAIGVFERVFGAGDGYLLLRYLLAVASGLSLYLCVRRFASVSVALGTAVLLYLQPFFSRMLLWDYSAFVEVSVGLAGVALWFWSDRRRLSWTLLPGAALAAGVFANALFGTAVLVLFLVEGVAAIRQRGPARIAYFARLGVAAVAAIGVFLLGYLSYLEILGGLSPYDLLRPTIKFLAENSKNSSPYRFPASSWLLREPRIWGPVIMSIALVAVLRRRILAITLEARIAQMCVAYTAFLWLYRFLITSSVIETWWAYSVVVVAMAPAMGVLLHELVDRSTRPRRWAAIALGAFALTAILIRDVSGPANEAYSTLAKHEGLLVALLAIGVTAAVGIGSRVVPRAASLTLLVVVLAIMSFAPSVLDGRGTTGIFVTRGSTEWNAYGAGQRFADLVRNYDNPKHRVFLWYPGLLGYVSIAWLDLPQDADTLNEVGVPTESLGHLTPLGAARLKQPEVAYVLIIAPRLREVLSGSEALAAGGFGQRLVRGGELANGDLQFRLVAITSK
jgi:hypothetical protein